MYRKSSVPIPTGPGKITRKHSSDGSVYIYLETGRTYHKDKGYTIPARVCIGKQDPKDDSRMFPNEKYFECFPLESATTMVLFPGTRSSCLHTGTHVVMKRILEKYRILDWLQAPFSIKPHKVRSYLDRRDPDFAVKLLDVLLLYKEVNLRS